LYQVLKMIIKLRINMEILILK